MEHEKENWDSVKVFSEHIFFFLPRSPLQTHTQTEQNLRECLADTKRTRDALTSEEARRRTWK